METYYEEQFFGETLLKSYHAIIENRVYSWTEEFYTGLIPEIKISSTYSITRIEAVPHHCVPETLAEWLAAHPNAEKEAACPGVLQTFIELKRENT